MKKILLLLNFLFLPIIVNADEVYYGDYYLTNDYKNVQTDLLKIDKVKKYNTFNIVKKDMGYLKENDSLIKDENDYIELSNKEELISIQTGIKSVNTISFFNILNNLKIYEIEVFNNNDKLDYQIYKTINLGSNLNSLQDNNYDTYYVHPISQEYLILLFDEYYNTSDITIKIYTKQDNDVSMNMALSNAIYLKLHANNELHTISFKYLLNGINLVNYEESKDILYKYYQNELVKTNNYVLDGDNLLLDDYIYENVYYKRDKLVLKDEIIINKKEYDINDYVLYKSNNINYYCNIDININGRYYCNFSLNDINITKDVFVDIKEDYSYYDNTIMTKSNIVKVSTLENNNKVDVVENIVNNNKQVNKKTKTQDKRNNKKKIRLIIALILIIIDLILIIKKENLLSKVFKKRNK